METDRGRIFRWNSQTTTTTTTKTATVEHLFLTIHLQFTTPSTANWVDLLKISQRAHKKKHTKREWTSGSFTAINETSLILGSSKGILCSK